MQNTFLTPKGVEDLPDFWEKRDIFDEKDPMTLDMLTLAKKQKYHSVLMMFIVNVDICYICGLPFFRKKAFSDRASHQTQSIRRKKRLQTLPLTVLA